MAPTPCPLLTRFLLLLAWFQVMGPAVSSVADAWRLDALHAYVHMESESGPGCALVHAHECLLCSVATGPNGSALAPPHTSMAVERAPPVMAV